jgi:hypothetical protein
MANPLLVPQMAAANADLTARVDKNNQLYTASRDAADAADYLRSKGPAGDWLLRNPGWASYIPAGQTIAQALPSISSWLPEDARKMIQGLSKDDIQNMLSASATVQANGTKLAAAGGLDPSVLTAPADVQIAAYKQGQNTARLVAKGGGRLFGNPEDLPQTVFAWRPGTTPAVADTAAPEAASTPQINISGNIAAPPLPAGSGIGSMPFAGPIRKAGDVIGNYFGPSAETAAAAEKPIGQNYTGPLAGTYASEVPLQRDIKNGKIKPGNPASPETAPVIKIGNQYFRLVAPSLTAPGQ